MGDLQAGNSGLQWPQMPVAKYHSRLAGACDVTRAVSPISFQGQNFVIAKPEESVIFGAIT